MIHAVIRTSLSTDPQVLLFSKLDAARNKMAIILAEAGWPVSAAREAAEKGSSCLVADDGDSDEIRIRHLEIQD